MSGSDARVRYTLMVIERAFLELLEKTPLAKITVTEICRKAEINRATFYKHYLDVFDLMEKLEENLFAKIRAASDAKKIDLCALLTDMVNTKEIRERYLLLGGENGDTALAAKTFQVCLDSIYPVWKQNIPDAAENEQEMLYYYLSHGAEGVIRWWICEGMKTSPEEISEYIMALSESVVEGMLKRRYIQRNGSQ